MVEILYIIYFINFIECLNYILYLYYDKLKAFIFYLLKLKINTFFIELLTHLYLLRNNLVYNGNLICTKNIKLSNRFWFYVL